jgi:hypothetical protein
MIAMGIALICSNIEFLLSVHMHMERSLVVNRTSTASGTFACYSTKDALHCVSRPADSLESSFTRYDISFKMTLICFKLSVADFFYIKIGEPTVPSCDI